MIEPIEKNHPVYEKYYAVFKTLYETLKDSMHSFMILKLKVENCSKFNLMCN